MPDIRRYECGGTKPQYAIINLVRPEPGKRNSVKTPRFSQQEWFTPIDRASIRLAGVGMVSTYVNICRTQLDFSGTLIGTLASIGSVLSLAPTPILNQVADRFWLHGRLLMLYLGGYALADFNFASTKIQFLLILAVLLIKVTVSPGMTLGMRLTMSLVIRGGKSVRARYAPSPRWAT